MRDGKEGVRSWSMLINCREGLVETVIDVIGDRPRFYENR
jgi:hypothetical protein